jgi:phosphoribosylamine--glycine ligase
MKFLIVGSGGREHAICRALRTGSPAPEIAIAPGNAGTAGCADNVEVDATDIEGLVELARSQEVGLVIPGPEAPLVAGLADALADAGIPCCGPSAAAARLEGSKRFMRELTTEAGVPGAAFEVVESVEALADAVARWDGLPVVKADGLAAGKGVFLPESKEACIEAGAALLAGSLGDAGRVVVVEERLAGVEASLFYACHGTDAVALPHARDHKRLLDGDAGPNTGGMGAISPNPLIDEPTEARVREEIVLPTLRALAERDTPYSGFLFAGLMLTEAGPRLLEYNVRLGDPEAQAVLPRIQPGQLAELCLATANGNLGGFRLTIDPRPTCAIVVAAHGYPGTVRKGDRIVLQDALHTDDRWLDHAGTRRDGHDVVTSGGRVAAIVARAETADAARDYAYAGVELLAFDGMQLRRDIGADRSIGGNP